MVIVTVQSPGGPTSVGLVYCCTPHVLMTTPFGVRAVHPAAGSVQAGAPVLPPQGSVDDGTEGGSVNDTVKFCVGSPPDWTMALSVIV